MLNSLFINTKKGNKNIEMKKSVILFCLSIFCLNSADLIAMSNKSTTVVYPVPAGLITSPDFTAKVNNQDVWVEKTGDFNTMC